MLQKKPSSQAIKQPTLKGANAFWQTQIRSCVSFSLINTARNTSVAVKAGENGGVKEGWGGFFLCWVLPITLFFCPYSLSPPALIKTGSILVPSAVIDLIRCLPDSWLQLLVTATHPAYKWESALYLHLEVNVTTQMHPSGLNVCVVPASTIRWWACILMTCYPWRSPSSLNGAFVQAASHRTQALQPKGLAVS